LLQDLRCAGPFAIRTEIAGIDEREPMLRQLLPRVPGALRRDHCEQSAFSRDIDLDGSILLARGGYSDC